MSSLADKALFSHQYALEISKLLCYSNKKAHTSLIGVITMTKFSFPNSISARIPLLMAAVIIPLLALLVIYNFYSGWLLQRQAAVLGKNTISLFGSQVDSILEMIDKTLLNTDVEDASSHSSLEDERVLAQMRVRNSLEKILGTYEFLDGVFAYSPEQGLLVSSMVSYDDLAKKNTLIAQTETYVQAFEEGDLSSWAGIQIGEDFCLLRILRRDGYDIGIWIDITRFLKYLEDAEIQKLDYVGLVFQSDAPLFSDYPQFSQQFNLEKSQQDFDTCQFDGETYIAISTPLDSGDLSLVALLRTTSILMEVTAFQYVIVFVTALLMMTAPFFLVLINRRIIAPARQICSVMQDFGQGNLSIRFQQPHVYEEFQLIGSTFNHMATEIGQLKIAAYEKQLDAQRTEMQFLQLQLTPHFYITSLNVIYSLAQTADFPTIQKMVLALTKYFRYSLQSHSALVPLRDEIQHVESYVAIQKMRYSDRLTVHCQVPQELMGRDVPLFLLQTFVENSMKYAFTGESAVRVEVQAALGDNKELIVSIRDNGPGYPASILDGSLLNDTANSHIGIENVRKRLALLYQEKASLVLSNPPDGGAQATIVIPSE